MRPSSLKEGTAAKLKREEATASNVASPKGISKKTRSKDGTSDLTVARRRLSVVSDNKLVEGMTDMNTNEDSGEGTSNLMAVGTYAGKSKKGYAPYNPRKKNQVCVVYSLHIK